MANENSLQEMQILEQSLQNVIYQKQAFQMELSESESALEEVEKSGDEVFKIIGGFMIKSEKSKIVEDLSKKKKMIELRIQTLDKQESAISEKLEKLRESISEKK